MFTLEPDQIEESRSRLDKAYKMAVGRCGFDSALVSLAKTLRVYKGSPITSDQLLARICAAEIKLVDSLLIMLGENVTSLIRGGLQAKWAWHRYLQLPLFDIVFVMFCTRHYFSFDV